MSHHGDVLHVGIKWSTTLTHIRMHHINSSHTCSMLASNTHASYHLPSLLLIASAVNSCKPTLPPLPIFCPLILTQPPTSFTGCYLVLFSLALHLLLDVRCRNKITGHRGAYVAYHALAKRGAETLSVSCLSDKHKKRELSLGQRPSKGVPRQGTGKRPRQGNGKHA